MSDASRLVPPNLEAMRRFVELAGPKLERLADKTRLNPAELMTVHSWLTGDVIVAAAMTMSDDPAEVERHAKHMAKMMHGTIDEHVAVLCKQLRSG